MIVVFGAVSMDIHAELNGAASTYSLQPGGKGLGQAIMAARSGAHVTLIGHTGTDAFAKTLRAALKNEGVDTAHISESGTLPTGMNIHMKDSSGDRKAVCISAANTRATSKGLPDDLFHSKSFVLVQTELSPEENLDILSKAKAQGATTIMNLSPMLNLSQKLMDHLDYMIVNSTEAHQLSAKLGLGAGDDALKLASGVAKQGKLTCIVTIGGQGSVAYDTDGRGWRVHALNIGKVVDHTGAEDAYCGTLAACLQAGMPLPRAMKRASIAGSLACTIKGGLPSLPRLNDIDSRINDIEDPEEVSA